MTIKLPTRFLYLNKRRTGTSDARAAWDAELEECYKRRMSLRRRMKHAQRAGDHRKLADLERQDRALSPDPEWPNIKSPAILAALIDQTSGGFVGALMENEWDKTIPQKLRNDKGRAIWEILAIWRQASEDEKRNLSRRLERSRDDVSYVLLRVLDHFRRGDVEFFSKLGIAFEEERCAFQELKEELIAYRFSLNFSLTPGQPRHTIAEIKQIVAPKIGVKNLAVFRNMIREFAIPHLPDKREKASPNYGNNALRTAKDCAISALKT